eukprot:6429694-Alexandrium_andersonii.AAC.1
MLNLAGLHAMPSSACALGAAAFSRAPSVPWLASPAAGRRRLGPMLAHGVALSRLPGHRATSSPIVV